MNVYLLPHHRLDPRFRYTLEREVTPGKISRMPAGDGASQPPGFSRRQVWRLRQLVRRLRHDYDQLVHGHEHIRLSKLLLLMDSDPELTLVVPAGMTREWALEAIRGVIRAGLMAHRWPTVRNVSTALLMMIILFGITPTHFAALIFYPLIGLYAWRRYWEDRLIRRIMKHLLEVRLAADETGRVREEVHLAYLEEAFDRQARPDVAYREAISYLDGLDNRMDGKSTPEHTLLYNYYHDIGQFDPYERFQDRVRKQLVQAARAVVHTISGMLKLAWRWFFARTRLVGIPVPNWTFVVATLGIIHLAVWVALSRWINRLNI